MAVPFISGAVAGFSGQITTIFPDDPGLQKIYGGTEETHSTKGAETTMGTLSPAVTTIAALECAEVVKIILGKGDTCRNKLFFVDLLDSVFEILTL
jgi:molybdopterin/thiamine biosynthesis adenylyltransferase